jgi:nitrate reductase NapAB chaperone NapD
MTMIGSLVVHAHAGQELAVLRRLDTVEGVSVVGSDGRSLAVVLEADNSKQQVSRHKEIARWPEVEQALVVFQGRDDEEEG